MLLIGLSQLLPLPQYLRFTGKGSVHGHRVPDRIPEVRGKALVPIPLRYIEAARPEARKLMAMPEWQSASPDERHDRLMSLLTLQVADADYWTMSEKHQRQVGEAFIQAFLNEAAAPPVDK